MIYRNFRLIVVFRVLLLLFNTLAMAYFYSNNEFITSWALLVLLVVQTVLLIVFAEQSNQRLIKFLDSIRYNDFAATFSSNVSGKTFEHLNDSFNEVIKMFKKTRVEKETQYNYLQTVIQHINIGIIAYRKDGMIDIVNNAIKRIFEINNLTHINQLQSLDENIVHQLLNIHSGDTILIKLYKEDEVLQLTAVATEFKKQGEEYFLVSFQDIHAELEAKEIESWQKLIRVLTHEIMNSITPISSLTNTLNQMIFDEKSNELKFKNLSVDEIENVKLALETIGKRSEGLLNFVEIYRNLTRIPKPNFRHIPVLDLFQTIEQLFMAQLKEKNIRFSFKILPDNLHLTADPDLIEQVLINLYLNAIHALEEQENPEIKMIARQNLNNHVIIELADNGIGIKPDLLDKIFMPFFTSKKEGSGIGLSLSRQIMHMHKGSIHVKSIPRKGSVFTLVF
ncbi:MAG TPA: ATP-binding protein [Bacteroidales bacterium]|nr:ATP-binding protein [Bacteroidales bacterium]